MRPNYCLLRDPSRSKFSRCGCCGYKCGTTCQWWRPRAPRRRAAAAAVAGSPGGARAAGAAAAANAPTEGASPHLLRPTFRESAPRYLPTSSPSPLPPFCVQDIGALFLQEVGLHLNQSAKMNVNIQSVFQF